MAMNKKIPVVSVEQMREVDRLMVEEFGIKIEQMMEIAGMNTAELSRKLLGGKLEGKKILAAAGVGNNGGDAMAAARYLTNWGADAEVLLVSREKLHDIPKSQLYTLYKMGMKIYTDESDWKKKLLTCNFVVDGILGYNIKGNPRSEAATLIKLINLSNNPVLAIDVPSGLDAQTGSRGNPSIKATATIALSLPKTGTVKSQVNTQVGRLFVADMSVPHKLYKRLGLSVPNIFKTSPIVSYK
jgi:NAD(P)H-hydrate epimerase